ncbi:hypothetical protein BELL_0012g00050 [Botrytis elliptica]|uniref:Uncharacterized protein n=1 Tax=Botrytis elliptica TaxID=278938 RepID=A0A4Z1KFH4_9HELO|nr:hypothetical protein BELL_0012g00050 [Botrytis elliptica]
MTFQYSIHRVPCSPTETASTPPTLLPYLAGKFSALRLSALVESPNSFASTFELESLYSASVWLSRFSRPKCHYFLAVAHASSSPPETHTIDTGLLVGSVQLYGPSPTSFFTLPLGGAPPPGPDAQELKYQMIALYSSSLHRRKGLAKMLIQGAIESARNQAQVEGKEKECGVCGDGFLYVGGGGSAEWGSGDVAGGWGEGGSGEVVEDAWGGDGVGGVRGVGRGWL